MTLSKLCLVPLKDRVPAKLTGVICYIKEIDSNSMTEEYCLTIQDSNQKDHYYYLEFVKVKERDISLEVGNKIVVDFPSVKFSKSFNKGSLKGVPLFYDFRQDKYSEKGNIFSRTHRKKTRIF